MKNKEKYAEEIVECMCDDRMTFGITGEGEIVSCKLLSCGNCKFYSESSCLNVKKRWAEMESVPELTEKEKEILRMLDNGWKYIVKSNKGGLYICKEIPTFGEHGINMIGECKNISRVFNHSDFDAIKKGSAWKISTLIDE